MATICIFGDSITCGYYDLEAGGWADRLWVDLLNSKEYHQVYKLAIDGDTTDGLLKIMDLECEVRQPDLIIVMKGANDSAWSKGRNDNIVPFERFKINLQKILEVAQKHKSKIVFIGIIPHDEGKLSPLPWEHDLYQKDEYIIKYNEAIKEFCQKKELPFLNLLEQLGADFVKFSQDGCHPNSEGHKVIYDCVKKFLLDNKLI